jgi:hypothetical protein
MTVSDNGLGIGASFEYLRSQRDCPRNDLAAFAVPEQTAAEVNPRI